MTKHSVDFLSLQETLISGDASRVANAIWSQQDFVFCQVPSNIQSGGLLCVWNKNCFDAVGAFARNVFLCVEGRWNGGTTLISLINVYAPQDNTCKRSLWLDICSYLATSSTLFCIMGDFNSVRIPEQRDGV